MQEAAYCDPLFDKVISDYVVPVKQGERGWRDRFGQWHKV